ncbi:ATP-dependent RNA helicase DBP10 [Sporobolomyces salmoneus]|uniref:ATP-dependent RNA helicase DBP10 n=1 Tax=Sporobolomyces salmoneus TaxID=183962 RepID=UPI0031812AD6
MDSDSDSDHIDIASALLGRNDKKKQQKSNKKSSSTTSSVSTSRRSSTGTGKGKGPAQDEDEEEEDEVDSEEDAIFASLSQLQHSRNLSEGAALIRKGKDSKSSKTLTGGGSFQALGLPPLLLKTLLQRGFTTPTPIQRLALPSILGTTEVVVTDQGKKLTVARDHLCMARTGSGKTLCYLLPLLTRLWTHSEKFGARGLVLVPTRELAMQVLKVGKDLCRGIRGEGEALRWAMVVGGEAMEAQFETIAGNPDVIIATPGRFLHLLIEMSLSLANIQSLIIDEADRLFELGFSDQLTEILHRVPPTRQTLLFSATLPSSLVGFAKAGLQNPKLIRLDVDQKISKDLQMAYLDVKASEKEAVLLGLLRERIGVPVMTEQERDEERKRQVREAEQSFEEVSGGMGKPAGKGKNSKFNAKKQKQDGGWKGKRKRDGDEDDEDEKVDGAILSPHQTVVFVSTKHHVEYLSALLTTAHYSVSAIYGSMDQTARKIALSRFRNSLTSILVVTDLAARGIDVPGVENVINYDFPNGTRAFVHRVGRTARAGRTGWAYTFVTAHDLPHMLDLELFLSRPLKLCPTPAPIDFAQTLVLGSAPRSLVDLELEAHRSLLSHHPQLETLQQVAGRGQKMYERGLGKASPESYRRAKEIQREKQDKLNGIAGQSDAGSENPVFDQYMARSLLTTRNGGGGTRNDEANEEGEDLTEETVQRAKEAERERADLLAKISGFRPSETVFEVGTRGKRSTEPLAALMKERRKAMLKSERARELVKKVEESELPQVEEGEGAGDNEEEETELFELEEDKPSKRMRKEDMDDADEEELEAVFGKKPTKRSKPTGAGATFRDPRFYLHYEQEGAATEAGYALTNGDSFVAQAAHSTYDVSGRGDTEGTPAEAQAQKASALKWDRRQKKFVRADQVGADNKKMIRSESGHKLSATFKSGVFDDWKKKSRTYMPKIGEAELAGRTTTGNEKKWRHQGQKTKMDEGEKGKGKRRRIGKPGSASSAPGGLKTAADIRKDRISKEKRVKRSNQPSKKNPNGYKGPSNGGGGGKGGGGGGRKK